MSRVLPLSTGRGTIGYDEQTSSFGSYGGEGGAYVPVNEGSVGSAGSGSGSEDDGAVSDCESGVTGSVFVEQTSIEAIESNGLVRLGESDKLHGIIGKRFVSRLREVGVDGQVECIERNMFNASAIDQARVKSFQIFTKAVEKRNGGDANVKYGWFGGSNDEINKIVLHGFGYDNMKKNGFCEHAVVLSADHSPLESVESAIADEDGTKHILLCRVLLGKTELVNHGSMQSHPSSDNFQSGVDNLVSPNKYIVWSSQMNTHVLPEFVISFKTLSSMNRPKLDGGHVPKPVSPWIPIPELIAALSKILPPKAINEMTQFRRSYMEHKISRHDMIRGIRRITGDRMLLVVLKNFTEKRRSNRFG